MILVMNQEPSTGKSTTMSAAEAAFVKLFAAGVIGWLVGSIALFGLSWVLYKPVSVPAAIVWTISHNWAGFLFGVLVLLAYGIKSGLSIGRAAAAYILPVGLLAVIGGLCLLIYPDHSLREELFTYLPMVLMFYGIALLWIWARKGGNDSDYFVRAVIPSILGGLVIVGFVTVPVFGSDAFRYRNTFQLTISKAEMKDGKFVADATLEVREPGNYGFIAPRYVYYSDMEDAEMEEGVMVWGAAGEPKADVAGVHPVQIIWTKALLMGESMGYDSYEGYINIEVHNPDEGNKVIYYLSAPIPTP